MVSKWWAMYMQSLCRSIASRGTAASESENRHGTTARNMSNASRAVWYRTLAHRGVVPSHACFIVACASFTSADALLETCKHAAVTNVSRNTSTTSPAVETIDDETQRGCTWQFGSRKKYNPSSPRSSIVTSLLPRPCFEVGGLLTPPPPPLPAPPLPAAAAELRPVSTGKGPRLHTSALSTTGTELWYSAVSCGATDTQVAAST